MSTVSRPPIRYPLASPDLSGNEVRFVTRALRAGHVSGAAPEIAAFEAGCAASLDVPHALAVASGLPRMMRCTWFEVTV